MSNNMNLFSDNDCRKVLTDANGTIKSPNFPLPYPDQTYCVWIILLEKISKIKIQVLAFDLSPYGEDGDEAWNYLKITSCDDPIIIRGGDRYELPIEIERKCLWTEVVFSGVSMYGNYGFLLKYYSYENPNILIVSNESVKAVTLNTKGMYVKYAVVIIAGQILCTKTTLLFVFQKYFSEKLYWTLVIKLHLLKGTLEEWMLVRYFHFKNLC